MPKHYCLRSLCTGGSSSLLCAFCGNLSVHRVPWASPSRCTQTAVVTNYRLTLAKPPPLSSSITAPAKLKIHSTHFLQYKHLRYYFYLLAGKSTGRSNLHDWIQFPVSAVKHRKETVKEINPVTSPKQLGSFSWLLLQQAGMLLQNTTVQGTSISVYSLTFTHLTAFTRTIPVLALWYPTFLLPSY